MIKIALKSLSTQQQHSFQKNIILLRRSICKGFCTGEKIVLGEYVIQSKIGGSSEENLYNKYKNFKNKALLNLQYDLIPGTTVITNKDEAHKVVKILKTLTNR